MSERGVFAVDRGIFDHARFADEPFTEREAWIWLIGQAAFRPYVRRVASITVSLAPGQLAHSTRFMAEKWQWSEARVRRFLDRLKGIPGKIDAMIDAATDAGITVITIRNYLQYQRVSLPRDAAIDAENDAPATHQRRKEECIKDIKEDDDGGSARAREDDGSPVSGSLVSPESIEIANELAEIAGHDPAFVPPSWCGAPMRVQAWRSANPTWTREIIIHAARHAMQRKRDGPPASVNYFEKAIARLAAEQARPIAKTETADETATEYHPRTWQGSRDAFREAFAELQAGNRAREQFEARDSGDPGREVAAIAAPARRP